jgi:hypothetical protein
MPKHLVNNNGHLFGFDDETGKYFIVEVKDIPIKAAAEDDIVALDTALSNGTAILWEDPKKKLSK